LSRQHAIGAILESVRRVIGGGLQALSNVVLHGLTNNTELNGVRGMCIAFQARSGRWDVELRNGDIKSVRPENLQAIGRIARPIASVGSTRAARQIRAALLAVVHSLKKSHMEAVKGLFDQQLSRHILHGQGGVVLALARVAGMRDPTTDMAPDRTKQIAAKHLGYTLADACQQESPPCFAHLVALLNAGCDVNVRSVQDKTALEGLASSSADVGDLLGPVNLLIRHGARARSRYISTALRKSGEHSEIEVEVVIASEWQAVWRAMEQTQQRHATA